MKVIKADVLGFCMGVRRAFDLAVKEAGRASAVYTLGQLVHNPKVLDDLKKLGLLNDLPPDNSTVIIRAHGISPDAQKELADRGCKIVDATCPKVKENQLKTRALAEDGYFLFLAGEAQHAEIKGLLGYGAISCARNICVVGDASEAKSAAASLYKSNKDIKTALLGQTTISQEEYSAIGEEIKKYFPALEIVNTICSATTERQRALRDILPLADAVIIAGGKESANTQRLFAIAKESGKPCVLAENAASIPASFFAFNTVGISAGASTPDSVIEEIENMLA
ncbi:MAG: 4-hydroxy-3-methylbut-2-enyl diphosphate reductase [Treponema sp.]|nr:4-hydroxy-3-methylbut-2-enyl diphosphate reductase [Treponema sp.]